MSRINAPVPIPTVAGRSLRGLFPNPAVSLASMCDTAPVLSPAPDGRASPKRLRADRESSRSALSLLVGEGGLEPPRPEGHWHLKPARLPFRHSPERRVRQYHGGGQEAKSRWYSEVGKPPTCCDLGRTEGGAELLNAFDGYRGRRTRISCRERARRTTRHVCAPSLRKRRPPHRREGHDGHRIEIRTPPAGRRR